jgi:N-acetylglucosamine-6-phosphate deacetylase
MVFISKRVYTGLHSVFAGYVKVDGSSIREVGEGMPKMASSANNITEDGYLVVDVGDDRVIPGLIDLHMHGGFGKEIPAESIDDLRELSLKLAENGTTAFQPTTGSHPVKVHDESITMVRDFTKGPLTGARSLGLHMEGPFLNPARKGAMLEECILKPNLDQMKAWIDLGQGTINHVTIAPEMPGGLELARYLYDEGVTVAAGHTLAAYQEMLEGFRAGVSVGNHTFNAMKGLHHREPGALGAVLTEKSIYCELVADGIHVHPGAMRLLIAAKGLDKVVLITDSSTATGLPPGKYVFDTQEVTIDERGKCALPDGTIAGSTIVLMDALRNVVEMLGVPFEDALRMATVNPARVARATSKGKLMPGKDADLVVIDDEYNVKWSLVEGKIIRKDQTTA